MVADFQGLEKGTVKIGGFNSVCSVWIPKIAKTFLENFPNIRLEIYQGTYEDVAEWLRNGTIDIALLSRVSAEGFDFVPLYQDRLMCVVPKGFQTADGKCITFEEMKEQRFVTQWQSCDDDVRNVIQKHGIGFSAYCHVVDDMSTVAMVESGFGICILPELLRTVVGQRVDWYPFEEEQYREIGYALKNRKAISPAVRKMIETIERFVEVLPK